MLINRPRYFAGQGRVYLADRDANGKAGDFTDIGNVSRLAVHADGRIEMTVDQWDAGNWPIIFGSPARSATTDDFIRIPDSTEVASTSAPVAVVSYDLNPAGIQKEFCLVYDAINCASVMPQSEERFRLELYRVTFSGADLIDLSDKSISGFVVHGQYRKDEQRERAGLAPYGRAYVWECPRITNATD